MIFLNKGEYTGEIVQSYQMDGSIITNTLYSTNKNNPDWHNHENLHICFVYEGGKAEKKNQTIYSKKEGSIFFYHSEEMHRWISPLPSSRSANIEIELSFLDKYDLTEESIKNAIENNISAKALILQMQSELLRSDVINHMSLEILLLELISYENQRKYLFSPQWVERLKGLLHDKWNEVVSLEEISNELAIHPVTISRNFRKYFNCTLSEYQRRIKVEKSIDLIKNTSLSLSEIAIYSGFSDQSHFIRNFKRLTGFLPKNYRKF